MSLPSIAKFKDSTNSTLSKCWVWLDYEQQWTLNIGGWRVADIGTSLMPDGPVMWWRLLFGRKIVPRGGILDVCDMNQAKSHVEDIVLKRFTETGFCYNGNRRGII